MSEKIYYFDHAATTPTHPEVVAAMLPYFTEHFGNPSSLYGLADESREAVTHARGQVADALGASPGEIFFTAGGTESDNWALKGVALANREKGDHIITTAIEHHAILHTCEFLERQGFSVTYLPVDRYGMVDPAAVEEAITDRTILVSVMTANNEVGTIQPIAEIGAVAHKHGVLFHTDAVQAVGNVPIDVDAMQIDLLSLSGHKFYGPKGTGALYIRDGVAIETFVHGGGQEKGRRAGTENLPGLVGLGAAIKRACDDIHGHTARVAQLRDRFLDEILESVPEVTLNGHPTERLPGNINISFAGIDGEALLTLLGMQGVCASTGSACSSGEETPSHVLTAMGVPPSLARASLRLSLGDLTTEADVDFLLDTLPDAVARLRRLSRGHA
ncbi:cysteine desulfurase NifS [Methanofollis aquaemaris]|uniref:Cysteine desulfurase IscS n=1 Tax=Methanofollis aquaemaris TaxID=126734 RepID=A0A8A3S309_9EURY|nr:cysteine desulfurase NifS [Methanofollis aquaemaris]QSZ66657.1 cysteine desulfurase NifS [Methanofollis aquaemaris]